MKWYIKSLVCILVIALPLLLFWLAPYLGLLSQSTWASLFPSGGSLTAAEEDTADPNAYLPVSAVADRMLTQEVHREIREKVRLQYQLQPGEYYLDTERCIPWLELSSREIVAVLRGEADFSAFSDGCIKYWKLYIPLYGVMDGEARILGRYCISHGDASQGYTGALELYDEPLDVGTDGYLFSRNALFAAALDHEAAVIAGTYGWDSGDKLCILRDGEDCSVLTHEGMAYTLAEYRELWAEKDAQDMALQQKYYEAGVKQGGDLVLLGAVFILGAAAFLAAVYVEEKKCWLGAGK